MPSIHKQMIEITDRLQALKLDDDNAPRRRHGAFVTKVNKTHVFFVCMHVGYSFKRTVVQFPQGIEPGWWIGLERTDGRGINDKIESITNVRRAMKIFDVIYDPKHPKEISVQVKFVKRDLSAYPHLAKRVNGEFQKTIPAELFCEEIGDFTDPYGLADDCKETVLYEAVIILKMNRNGWNPAQTTVPNISKTLLGVGKRCPQEEQARVVSAPWILEVLSIDCIISHNQIKSNPRVGIIVEEMKLPNLDCRLLFVWNQEVGCIQIKLEKEHNTHPIDMVGTFIRFRTTLVAADEERGYKMKTALFCRYVEPSQLQIPCKIISVQGNMVEKLALAEVVVQCPTDMRNLRQNIELHHDFFGQVDIRAMDLIRACRDIMVSRRSLSGKQIPIYIKLTDARWRFHSVDRYKVEHVIATH